MVAFEGALGKISPTHFFYYSAVVETSLLTN